jgi:hypothetical protein
MIITVLFLLAIYIGILATWHGNVITTPERWISFMLVLEAFSWVSCVLVFGMLNTVKSKERNNLNIITLLSSGRLHKERFKFELADNYKKDLDKKELVSNINSSF